MTLSDDLTRLLKLRDKALGEPLRRLLRKQSENQYHPPKSMGRILDALADDAIDQYRRGETVSLSHRRLSLERQARTGLA
jgi:hypothetical protein